MIPTISGLINPLFSADWKLTLQDRSLGFIGGEVTLPLYLGGKINTANRAARINEQTAVEQSNQRLRAGFGARRALLRSDAGAAGGRGAAAGGRRRKAPSGGCRGAREERHDCPQRAALRAVQDDRSGTRIAECAAAGRDGCLGAQQHAGRGDRMPARDLDVYPRRAGGGSPTTRTWPGSTARCSTRCRSSGSWPRRG